MTRFGETFPASQVYYSAIVWMKPSKMAGFSYNFLRRCLSIREARLSAICSILGRQYPLSERKRSRLESPIQKAEILFGRQAMDIGWNPESCFS